MYSTTNWSFGDVVCRLSDDDGDVEIFFEKFTTRVSQNLILHKNADQPKA
jgi:hypothetical protein